MIKKKNKKKLEKAKEIKLDAIASFLAALSVALYFNYKRKQIEEKAEEEKAIELLKLKGYKVMKETTEFKEI